MATSDGFESKASASHTEYRPPNSKMSMTTFVATRIATLKPTWSKPESSVKSLLDLSGTDWCFFLVGFFGWTWDAFDFFTVSLTVTPLAEYFQRSNTDITWGITLVLMFRAVGSVIFGVLSDRYGLKWPFIAANALFVILELATGFVTNYQSFLACRALFGIAMGGLYGNAVATSLGGCRPEARGILSGIFQGGYSLGYLLATVFTRALVNTTPHGWRPLFWFGACPPVLIILFRLYLPESKSYERRGGDYNDEHEDSASFWREGAIALKTNWLLLIYLTLLMAGINFMAHGTQDLYPTLLSNTFGFSPDKVTVTQAVANIGAMIGAIILGTISEIIGRRISIMIMCILAGACIYPYCFVSTNGVIAAAFFEQFCVQGAFGVIPGHLIELSPFHIRAFVVGTSYQLGNLASSASSTIEAKLGERFVIPSGYNYGIVTAIFVACSIAFVMILILIGPEKRCIDLQGDEVTSDPQYGEKAAV